MFFCRKLTQEEEEIVAQKYSFTGYDDEPTTPCFIITNNDKNIEIFITSWPSHHRIGKGALVIDNHVCAIAFREDFFDKVNSGNLRQTWEIFHITIYSILRETQTIFGEQKNKELVNVILKAFEVLKLKKDHVVKTRVSKNYKIEYMEGRHYGILLR